MQRQLNKNVEHWLKICRMKMFTDNAILCTVSGIFGQDCLKKRFFKKLVISLEKINISCVLLLIHEVKAVSSLKGYIWSHCLLVMEKRT